MRHRVGLRKLGRTTEHRWAMFKNMLASLVDKERIQTTLHKAKELRRFADKIITTGKENTLAARREAFSLLRNKDLVRKVFNDLAPRFKDRNGGYTRIYKLGFRAGDSAPMALIEYLFETKPQAATKEDSKKTKKAPKKPVSKKEPKAKKEASVKKETKKAK